MGEKLTKAMAAAERHRSELERIVSLSKRPVLDCSRDEKRRWAPEAQALIELMTARYTRGPRLSCGCQKRTVTATPNGGLTIFRETKVPSAPLQTTTAAFLADNAHDSEVCERVRALRSGQTIELEGLGRPCIMTLNAPQAWILWELPKAGGILGYISIGAGKTFSALLAALAMPHCKSVVILAKPDQRYHYRKHYLHLREHFRVPSMVFGSDNLIGSYIVPGTPVVHFVPYSLLQQKKSTELLEQLNPDMIIADEAHCLSAAPSSSRPGSTRARRFLRYMAKRGNVHFCAWSGSLVNKSLLDVTHLSAHALGLSSPYPIMPSEVEAWSAVIDPAHLPDSTSPLAEALYRTFGDGVERPNGITTLPGMSDAAEVRSGLKDRAIHTLGVVSTKSASVTSSIAIHERAAPKIPDVVRQALAGVRTDWVRPDQEELVEAVEQIKCAREVGNGFFYRWIYPKGEPPELIEQWFACRKRYNKELRVRLRSAQQYLDSPSHCEDAAKRAWQEPRYEGELPVWPADSWPDWAAVKDLVDPSSKAVWIDDYLAADAAKWAQEHCGIIWYHSRALGMKIAQLAGINFHAGGKDAEANILAEKGDKSIVASISSHSEGRDGLQFKFHEQLIVENPSSGKAWDQLLGRLARAGQEADTIDTWVYNHISENKDALRKAIALAEFDEDMSPNESLLLAADIGFEL